MKDFLQDVKFWIQDLEFADVAVVLGFAVLEITWIAGMVYLLSRI